MNTSLELAEDFMRKYGNDVLICEVYDHKHDVIPYVRSGYVWKQDRTSLRKMYLQMRAITGSDRQFTEMLKWLGAVEAKHRIDEHQLDADLNYLSAPNGIINLSNGDLLRDITVYNTRQVSVDYKKGLDETLVFQYFPHIDREVLNWVLDSLAFALNGWVDKRVIILEGPTDSGKTVLSNLITLTLGEYCTTANEDVIAKPLGRNAASATPHLQQLIGARVTIIDEVSNDTQLNTGALKNYSGGGSTYSRELYKSPDRKMKTLTSTPIIIANEGAARGFRVDDQAVQSRLKIVPIDKVTKDIPDIRRRIAADTKLQQSLLLTLVQRNVRAKLQAPTDLPITQLRSQQLYIPYVPESELEDAIIEWADMHLRFDNPNAFLYSGDIRKSLESDGVILNGLSEKKLYHTLRATYPDFPKDWTKQRAGNAVTNTLKGVRIE